MKIDLNKTARRIKDIDDIDTIDKSRYLMKQVPCADYSGVCIYAVPVSIERITDPLFYRKAFFVGKIVAIQLGQDLPDIFTTKDDESIQKYAIKDRIGDTYIAKLSPKYIYTDGIHVYGVCKCYLIELEEMLLYYPISLKAEAYRNFRFGFIERDERAQIYENEIKPNMQLTNIFPLIKHQQADILNQYEDEIEKVERQLQELKDKHDAEFRIFCNIIDSAQKND